MFLSSGEMYSVELNQYRFLIGFWHCLDVTLRLPVTEYKTCKKEFFSRLIILIILISQAMDVRYLSIDNALIICTKRLNLLKVNMRGIHLKDMRGKPNVR
jgi:hypothetical protein